MKLSAILISTILIIFSLTACNFSSENIFTDETYQDTIKQNIGGSLIRNIHYYDDFTSAIYDIEYSYKDKLDSVCKIGTGSYYSKQPPKNEQLIRFDKWKIFKTSGDRDKDLLFICESNSKIWTEYEISPEKIEQSELWKKQKIDSRTDNWDSVAKVKKIDSNGEITVVYTFVRRKFIPFFKTGKRKVIYNLNKNTGKLQIIRIAKI